MMQIIGHIDEVSNRYHEVCYESACPYIFQDGNNLPICSIVLRKEFEEMCPFEIVKRHKVGLKKNEQ